MSNPLEQKLLLVGHLVMLIFMSKWTYCSVDVSPSKQQHNAVHINEYTYALERDRLVELEDEMENNRITLTEEEKIVSDYLNYLKWEEFDTTREEFPPSRPTEQQLEHIINSKVFDVLKRMPKGGSTHGHDTPVMPVRRLLEIGFESEDFQYMYIKSPNASDFPWRVEFSLYPEGLGPEWIRLIDNPEYTVDVIEPHQTFVGTITDRATYYPNDDIQRTLELAKLWGIHHYSTMNNAKLYPACLEALMQWNLDEGIQYIEFREILFNGMFVLDPDVDHPLGHREFDADGEHQLQLTLAAIESFKQQNPTFIGLAHIIAGYRDENDVELIHQTMTRAMDLHQRYPAYAIGYDLQVQEDIGSSAMFYLEAFLDIKRNESAELPLFMHTAETTWIDDLLTSQNDLDPVSSIQNAYESILLGAKRIGQGLGYIKHPYLLQELKKRDVAIEVSPVSQQMFGYISDIRAHPAVNYIRSGIPVVLGPDTPGTLGMEYFTVDWYEAFMAWGLDLRHLKMFAENSLIYSGIPADIKQEEIDTKWRPAWESYITEMVEEACSAELNTTDPIFSRILPRVGPVQVGTNVHVYGRHFQSAVCREISCMFGSSLATAATYRTNQHITCTAPPLDESVATLISDPITVPVYVSLGGEYIDTGETFTYHPGIVPAEE